MQRLILIAKLPRPGHVKTRLVPPLTTEQALGLYRAFLEDQFAWLATLSGECEIELCSDRTWTAETVPQPGHPGIRRTLQGEGSLGERLARAARRSRDEGASATVFVGADSPTLPSAIVREAFRKLSAGDEVAIAPAEDGGYVLLGMRAPRDALFADVPWSSDRVYEVTRSRLDSAGVRTAVLDPGYDVDDATGLARLREELADPRVRPRAPATARFLDACRCAML